MNDNSKDDPLPFIQLAAVVANVTRYLLREENQISHKQDRGPDAGNAEHDGGEDQRSEVANTRIGKSPRGTGDGGIRMPLSGSLLTAGGVRPCAASVLNGCAVILPGVLREPVGRGRRASRGKLYYVAVSW